ncbi:uncharacterized protein LOC143976105 isoform X2 [Lithobates pipiens]
MNKMDTIKQENYALLNDESDLEDFYKSDSTDNKPHGKTHMRSKVAWMQPQWACQTIFIMVLVLSQVALCVFVLTQNMDRKASDMEKTTLPTNRFDNKSSLKLENGTQLSVKPKIEHLQPEFHNMDPDVVKRVHSLETNIKSLKKAVSSQGEEIKTLLSNQQAQGQKGLELVFSQIAQLRDDIYFIESNLNQTKEERFGEATIKPTRGVIGQALTERLLTASQNVTKKTETTVQPVTKWKDDPEELDHISVSFLKSRADFQVFFYGADKDADGYLTYDEMKNVLAEEVPREDLLQHFDSDHDRLYSYTELIGTFFLKD